MALLPENIPALIEVAGADRFDTSLEPHILTDKDKVKVAPCRTCKRPCIVTQFASAAKVACEDHRDRKVNVQKMKEFDRTKETHVLTDKDKTKEVPCRSCGRPCIVNVFAAPDKVSCQDKACGGKVTRTTRWEKGDDGIAHEVKTVHVFDAEAFERAMEPTLPFWPDGDKTDRAKLAKLAAQEVTLREDYEEKRADLWRTRRKERKDGVREEELTPMDGDEISLIRVLLDDAHDTRKTHRKAMVAKLEKKRGRSAYNEVVDSETIRVGQIPVQRNIDRLDHAIIGR